MKKIRTFILTASLAAALTSCAPVETTEIIAENQTVEITTDFPKSFDSIRTGLNARTTDRIYFDANELTHGSDYDAFYDEILATDANRFFVESWTTYSDNSVAFTYYASEQEMANMTRENEAKVNEIASRILNKRQTDLEKVRAIHDYIANHVVYDAENFRNGTESPLVYTSYGALNQGVAVCDGYARAAMQLFDKAGIEARYVVGFVSGQLHAWNLVQVDGAWYHLDITWNDQSGSISNDYFLIGNDTIEKDHDWKQSDYPTTSPTDFSAK